MSSYLHNRQTYVWAFLAFITIVSWWVSQGAGAEYQVKPLVTVGVLLIAALKSQLVVRNFMEVSRAPVWLKRTIDAWLLLLLVLLFGFYFFKLNTSV